MSTGSDNLGNGAAKTEDRFAGQLGYRPRGNRDGGSLPASTRADGPLNGGPQNAGPSNGGSLNGGSLTGNPLGLGNPLTRSGSPLDGGPLDAGPLAGGSDDFGAHAGGSDDFGAHAGGLGRTALHIENPIASALREPTLPESDPVEPDLPFRGPVSLATDAWSDTSGKGVADHPLLRGLLLELPPKGATLQVQWLDRWFEAARSIVELLYKFEDKRD
jgi:hypothetical protein